MVVSVGSVQARTQVLKARKRLQNSALFATMGVEEDLTKRQQEAKNKAWPDFIKARKDGKKAFWRAGQLVVPEPPTTDSPRLPRGDTSAAPARTNTPTPSPAAQSAAPSTSTSTSQHRA